ncbi:unnamed protein product [Arabis nemorensis]|uniref:Uncharacterized protein n=1 Tax=Arabis nemorensis TaxID=586526 RepID=A0A565CPP9_9BRAS|nr:unnamed protein product [Arabis nemorensis]
MRIQVKKEPPQKLDESHCLDGKRFDEEVFDGNCLNLLFEENLKMDLEVEAPKITKEKPKKNKTSTVLLYPMKFVDGGIECKVKSIGGSKPFSNAKVILTRGLSKEEIAIINETMAKVLKIELTD